MTPWLIAGAIVAVGLVTGAIAIVRLLALVDGAEPDEDSDPDATYDPDGDWLPEGRMARKASVR